MIRNRQRMKPFSVPTYSPNALHKKLSRDIIIVNKLFKRSRHKNDCQQHYENFNILLDICTCKCSVNTIVDVMSNVLLMSM